MTQLAHLPSCACEVCKPNLSPAQREAARGAIENRWQADARMAGDLHRQSIHGLWNAAYLIARNVFPSKGGRPKSSQTVTDSDSIGFAPKRVSMRQFAEESGISAMTVSRYYATWQQAAVKGWVPPAEKLDYYGTGKTPKVIENLTDDQWDQVKPKMVSEPTSDVKASGAARPKVTAKDRSPEPENSVPAKSATGNNRPIETQHPIREAPELVDSVVHEFKMMRESLTLIESIDDKVMIQALNDPILNEFLAGATKLAKRMRSLRNIVEPSEKKEQKK